MRQFRQLHVSGGYGIGPEIAGAMFAVAEAAFGKAGVELLFEYLYLGKASLERGGEVFPDSLIESIATHGWASKEPMKTEKAMGDKSYNVTLRSGLELWANKRPLFAMPGVLCRDPQTDLVVVRENSEGLYCGEEQEFKKGLVIDEVISMRRITRTACLRISRFAFELARQTGKRVTLLHKANILKKGDGLFLHCFQEVAQEFPDVVSSDEIIDSGGMNVLLYPQNYDILLFENKDGDTASDWFAALVGGLGTLASVNLGDSVVLAEAVHGTADSIAGQNKANPTALILSIALGLREIHRAPCGVDLGAQTAIDIADAIENAVLGVYRANDVSLLTPDVKLISGGGGCGTTNAFAKAVIARL